jgi:hypothetical protein
MTVIVSLSEEIGIIGSLELQLGMSSKAGRGKSTELP